MQLMDLAELDTASCAAQGCDVRLLHPVTRAPIGAVIRVMGADAEPYRDAVRELLRAHNERLARERRSVATPDEQEEFDLALLVAATLAWSDLVEHGAPIVFSQQAARKIYRTYRWIAEQVREAIGERANFLPGSAPPL